VRRRAAWAPTWWLDPSAGDGVSEVKRLTAGGELMQSWPAVGSRRVDELAFQLVAQDRQSGAVRVGAPVAQSRRRSQSDPQERSFLCSDVEGKNVDDFRIAVKLLSERLIDVRPLIDRLVPLTDLRTAFELAIRPDTYRVVVTP